MASITLSQTRAEASSLYTVTTTATASTGIPMEVFVFTVGGVYDHVATLEDLELYPTVIDPSQPFYRQRVVAQTFPDVGEAVWAADTHKFRVEELVQLYTTVVENFTGNETVTYTGV